MQQCEGDRWSDWAGQQPVDNEDSFDGYQWLSDDAHANVYSAIAGATGQSYTPVAADVGHHLECTVTVTYALLQTTTLATSNSVTVIAQNSGPQGPAGSNGTNGNSGPQGPAGSNGTNGKNGAAVPRPGGTHRAGEMQGRQAQEEDRAGVHDKACRRRG